MFGLDSRGQDKGAMKTPLLLAEICTVYLPLKSVRFPPEAHRNSSLEVASTHYLPKGGVNTPLLDELCIVHLPLRSALFPLRLVETRVSER